MAIAAVLIAAIPGAGWAGRPVPYEISWAHSSPGLVQDFIIFVSPINGDTQSAKQLEVGKPFIRTMGGIAMYSAIIEIDPTEYLAIGARGYNGASSLSSWGAAQPTRPGQPLLVEP